MDSKPAHGEHCAQHAASTPSARMNYFSAKPSTTVTPTFPGTAFAVFLVTYPSVSY
jgi:hypothetical protein